MYLYQLSTFSQTTLRKAIKISLHIKGLVSMPCMWINGIQSPRTSNTILFCSTTTKEKLIILPTSNCGRTSVRLRSGEDLSPLIYPSVWSRTPAAYSSTFMELTPTPWCSTVQETVQRKPAHYGLSMSMIVTTQCNICCNPNT